MCIRNISRSGHINNDNKNKTLFEHDEYLKPEACGVVFQQN